MIQFVLQIIKQKKIAMYFCLFFFCKLNGELALEFMQETYRNLVFQTRLTPY